MLPGYVSMVKYVVATPASVIQFHTSRLMMVHSCHVTFMLLCWVVSHECRMPWSSRTALLCLSPMNPERLAQTQIQTGDCHVSCEARQEVASNLAVHDPAHAERGNDPAHSRQRAHGPVPRDLYRTGRQAQPIGTVK